MRQRLPTTRIRGLRREIGCNELFRERVVNIINRMQYAYA